MVAEERWGAHREKISELQHSQISRGQWNTELAGWICFRSFSVTSAFKHFSTQCKTKPQQNGYLVFVQNLFPAARIHCSLIYRTVTIPPITSPRCRSTSQLLRGVQRAQLYFYSVSAASYCICTAGCLQSEAVNKGCAECLWRQPSKETWPLVPVLYISSCHVPPVDATRGVEAYGGRQWITASRVAAHHSLEICCFLMHKVPAPLSLNCLSHLKSLENQYKKMLRMSCSSTLRQTFC